MYILYICDKKLFSVYLYSGKDQWEFTDEPNKRNPIVESYATANATNPSQPPTKNKFEDIPLSKGGIAMSNYM